MHLTEEEKQKLSALAQRVDQGLYATDRRTDQGASYITEATYLELCKAFNMPIDPQAGCVYLLGRDPFSFAMKIALDYYEYLPKTGGIYYQIADWLNKNFGGHPQSNLLENTASIGIAATLNAYHVQEGPTFIDQLITADPKALMESFGECTMTLDRRISLIERSRMTGRIPESQVFLNRFIERFAVEFVPSPFENIVRDGAGAMYHVIDRLASGKNQSPRQRLY